MSTYVYEPPRSNLPAGVTTGTVYGKFIRAIDDGADPGIITDAIPSPGYVYFTPNVPYIEHNGVSIILEQRRATLESTGDFSIDLVSTANTGPWANWSYRVMFDIPGLSIEAFNMTVDSGSNTNIQNLVPRTTMSPVVTVKGDKGDKGDMSIVGLNVFVDAQGDVAIDDQQRFYWGTGSPEGVLTAPKGCFYSNMSSTTTNILYWKSTASGATGWVVIK